MILIHKFFKIHSLKSVTSNLLIAASCVFLTAKILYMPVILEKVVQAFFTIEKRLNPSVMMRATLSKERELHYRTLIEEMESKVLETIGFDTELELPYPSIKAFCG
jgi:hypothetical protein